MENRPTDQTSDDDPDTARYGHLRSETRDSMLLVAAIRRPGGTSLPIKVRNLSPGGMMAECQSNFARGEAIEVDLRGIGWVAGTIAWGASGRFGVAFEGTIDPKLTRRLVAGMPQPQLLRIQKAMWRPGLGTR